MVEKQTGEVRINDISAEVIEELLRFMYTGKVASIEKVSEDLFSAAAKYDLKSLQGICEKQLAYSLTQSGDKLFTSGLHSDVTLLVEDRKFAVHKAILAAQSPVFASMFQHEMVEKQTGEVRINDISADVIEELLRFMYTGNVKNIEKNRELFAAAAKYNLEALKKICEKRLACSLSSENLYQTLVLAELHES
ncbi:unnamed protein product, partial [Cyprideis torosa]